MDKMSKEQRSRCMASIHSKGTKPEVVVRKYLFAHGFRYRLNHPRLPGHPEEQRKLAEMGWHCITVWECQLKPKVMEKTLQSLEYTLYHIYLEDHKVMRYEMPEEESMMAAEPDVERK